MRAPRSHRRRRLVRTGLAVLLAGTTSAGLAREVAGPGHAAAAESGQPSIAGTIRATTTTGRRGAYYLPPRRDSQALPLVVILHGTGGTGSGMLARLRAIAEREKFIVVAPDSVSIAGGWLVERGSRGVTEDHRHVLDCLGEILTLPGVRVDRAQVLIAGFSVGGGAASYIASHEEVFTAFASLHGHVVLDGMGPRRVRAWLSTGDRDGQRTVEYVRSVTDRLIRREGFPEVEMRVFRGGHTLAEEELVALVAWWLRRPDHGGALAPGRR